MTASFMCNAKRRCYMADTDSPYKTGFIDHLTPEVVGEEVCTERAFEWADGNPNDEDRTGYGVSLEDGKLVIGETPFIGVTTRVDEYDPSIQWVATSGFVDMRATRADGNAGYIDDNGRLYSTKKSKYKRGGRRIAIVMNVIEPPIYASYMYKRNVCEKEGLVRVLLW